MVVGLDGKDSEALQRRMAVREDHIKLGDQLLKEGKALFGYALLDDKGKMIGSVYVVDFPTRVELDKWLEIEPYVRGNVWQEIQVTLVKVGPSFMNRSKQM